MTHIDFIFLIQKLIVFMLGSLTILRVNSDLRVLAAFCFGLCVIILHLTEVQFNQDIALRMYDRGYEDGQSKR